MAELAPDSLPRLCPSAPATSDRGEIFGVIIGPPAEARVAYLTDAVPATPEALQLAQPLEPTTVFRIAAPCATSKCQHFDGTNCRLAQRVVSLLPAVVDRLPACQVRAQCRWFWQEGRSACLRCPQVVTTVYQPTAAMVEAATPAGSPGAGE